VKKNKKKDRSASLNEDKSYFLDDKGETVVDNEMDNQI